MELDTEVRAIGGDEGYIAPLVTRLGTVEELTAGSPGSTSLGDCSSSLC